MLFLEYIFITVFLSSSGVFLVLVFYKRAHPLIFLFLFLSFFEIEIIEQRTSHSMRNSRNSILIPHVAHICAIAQLAQRYSEYYKETKNKMNNSRNSILIPHVAHICAIAQLAQRYSEYYKETCATYAIRAT